MRKKKIDPVSALTLVKTEKMFRESKLGMKEDPETWINKLVALGVKLEGMGSNMNDEQC
jgi:hypothetical protein